MFDYAQDRLGLYRLAHDIDGARLLGFLCNVATTGDYNDRNLSKKRILGSFGEKTPSIEYRHHKVQKNHRWRIMRVGEQPKCFFAIRGTLYIMTPTRQEFGKSCA